MNYQSNRPDIAQAGPVQWLAIGIQPQWGYQTVHGTNPVTYDLPIPFEEAPFTVAISTGNSGNHASCGGFTKTTIVLRAGTTAGVWDTVGFFIIGCQLQWGSSASLSGYVAVCIFPISFTTTDYTAVATGVMSAADATFGKENYVNNILWDFTSESQVAFRLSHLDRPTLKYIAIGF